MHCISGKHVWTDLKYAKYCCHPNYVPVRKFSECDLQDAIGVHYLIDGGMWTGWKPRSDCQPFSQIFYEDLYVYLKQPGERVEETYLLQSFPVFDETGNPHMGIVVSGITCYANHNPAKVYVYSSLLRKLLKQAKSEEEESQILADFSPLF